MLYIQLNINIITIIIIITIIYFAIKQMWLNREHFTLIDFGP